MSYYPCVDVLSENDSISGSLLDLLSVSKGLYGRSIHNSLMWDLEPPMLEESHVHMFDILYACVILIICVLKDYFGVPREVV